MQSIACVLHSKRYKARVRWPARRRGTAARVHGWAHRPRSTGSSTLAACLVLAVAAAQILADRLKAAPTLDGLTISATSGRSADSPSCSGAASSQGATVLSAGGRHQPCRRCMRKQSKRVAAAATAPRITHRQVPQRSRQVVLAARRRRTHLLHKLARALRQLQALQSRQVAGWPQQSQKELQAAASRSTPPSRQRQAHAPQPPAARPAPTWCSSASRCGGSSPLLFLASSSTVCAWRSSAARWAASSPSRAVVRPSSA